MDLFDIAVAKKLSGGGGGGGFVHRTYEGTLANIMKMLPNYSGFATALVQGTAFARLTATLGADTATMTVVSNDGQVQASLQFLTIEGVTGIKAMATYIAAWESDGSLRAFELINNANDKTWTSTNYRPMASQVTCVLELWAID